MYFASADKSREHRKAPGAGQLGSIGMSLEQKYGRTVRGSRTSFMHIRFKEIK